jgi:hypothetical protein
MQATAKRFGKEANILSAFPQSKGFSHSSVYSERRSKKACLALLILLTGPFPPRMVIRNQENPADRSSTGGKVSISWSLPLAVLPRKRYGSRGFLFCPVKTGKEAALGQTISKQDTGIVHQAWRKAVSNSFIFWMSSPIYSS